MSKVVVPLPTPHVVPTHAKSSTSVARSGGVAVEARRSPLGDACAVCHSAPHGAAAPAVAFTMYRTARNGAFAEPVVLDLVPVPPWSCPPSDAVVCSGPVDV